MRNFGQKLRKTREMELEIEKHWHSPPVRGADLTRVFTSKARYLEQRVLKGHHTNRAHGRLFCALRIKLVTVILPLQRDRQLGQSVVESGVNTRPV